MKVEWPKGQGQTIPRCPVESFDPNCRIGVQDAQWMSEQSSTNPGPVPPWLTKLCESPRMVWLAPLLGVLLTLPSVLSGMVQDDHLYRQHSLDQSIYIKRSAWDYFGWLTSNADVSHYREQALAQVTWWTPESARARFFRPLASLGHAFEFRFLGSSPWVMHVNRALLYGLLIYLCCKLFKRLSSVPAACGLACLLFAVDDTHAFTTGWISGLNTLLACAFGMLGLMMHDRWRKEGHWASLALSLASLLFGLLSSEVGLALYGYLAAYAVFLESGSPKQRLFSLAPATLLGVGYLVFYAAQDMGVKGSFDYVSPSNDPVQTLLTLLSGTLLGTLSQILSLSPFTLALQVMGPLGMAATIGLLAGLVWLYREFLASNRLVGFFALGMVLSILPFTIGMMGDRYLLWAGFGAAGLLGELFTVYTTPSRLRRGVTKTLFLTNTVVSLLLFVPTLFWLNPIQGTIRQCEAAVTRQNTVLLNGHPIAVMVAAAMRYEKGGEWPQHFYHFYDSIAPLNVERTGERSLLVTVPHGWFSPSLFNQARRPRELRFTKGQQFHLQLLTATIEETTLDERPRKVRFTFKRDLSDFAWLQWTMRGPKLWSVPELGKAVQVVPWDG